METPINFVPRPRPIVNNQTVYDDYCAYCERLGIPVPEFDDWLTARGLSGDL